MRGTISQHVLSKIQNSAKPVGCAAVKEDKRSFSTKRLTELCEEYGIDPAKVALAALGSQNVKDDKKLEVAVKLMPYLYPTLKAVEHSGEVNVGLAELLESLNKRQTNDPPVEG